MEIAYRRLVPADSKRYRDIRLESLELHPDSFGAAVDEQRRLSKLMFEAAIEERAAARFVVGARDAETVIGICGFIADNPYGLPGTGVIVQMYVRAGYRGRNIGLRLVETTISEAFRTCAIDQVILEVRATDVAAIRVYQRAGFRPYDLGATDTTTRHMIARYRHS